jgi:hypothetical protein
MVASRFYTIDEDIPIYWYNWSPSSCKLLFSSWWPLATIFSMYKYKDLSLNLVPNNLTTRYFRFLELFLTYMRIWSC